MISFDNQIKNGKILIQKIKAYVYCYKARTYGDMFILIDRFLNDLDSATGCEKYEDPSKMRVVGYYVGAVIDGHIKVASSFCIPDDFHEFNAQSGKNLACVKLFADPSLPLAGSFKHKDDLVLAGRHAPYIYYLPYTAEESLKHFEERCKNYFKGYDFPEGYIDGLAEDKTPYEE